MRLCLGVIRRDRRGREYFTARLLLERARFSSVNEAVTSLVPRYGSIVGGTIGAGFCSSCSSMGMYRAIYRTFLIESTPRTLRG